MTQPTAYNLNTQLFTVVGPAYVPERTAELGRHMEWPAPARMSRSRRCAVLAAIAALVLTVANFSDIVRATARQAKSAPVVQVSSGTPSFSLAGGAETNRW